MRDRTKRASGIFLCTVLLISLLISGLGGTAGAAPNSTSGAQEPKLTITHSWSNDTEADRPAKIGLELYKSDDDIADAGDTLYGTYELSAGTSPKWSVEVPLSAEDAGSYFYVKTDVIDGYTTTNGQKVQLKGGLGGNDGLDWINPGAVDNLPLGSANYYSALIFGDYSVTGADAESGIAVKGNFKSTGGYAVGLPTNIPIHQSWKPAFTWENGKTIGYPVAPHSPRMIVGGSLSGFDNLHIVGGNLVVADNSKISGTNLTIKEWLIDPSIGEYDKSTDITGKHIDRLYGSAHSPYAEITEDADAVAKFFADAEVSMRALSNAYASMSGADKQVVAIDATDGNDIVLTPGDAALDDYSGIKTIVYNITVSTNQVKTATIDMQKDKNFTGNVVLNIIPASAEVTAFNFKNGDIRIKDETAITETYELARKYADRILWNIPADCSINKMEMASKSLIGSLLMPNVDLEVSGGSINGTLVARRLDSIGGFETHSTTKFGHYKPGIADIELYLSSEKDEDISDEETSGEDVSEDDTEEETTKYVPPVIVPTDPTTEKETTTEPTTEPAAEPSIEEPSAEETTEAAQPATEPTTDHITTTEETAEEPVTAQSSEPSTDDEFTEEFADDTTDEELIDVQDGYIPTEKEGVYEKDDKYYMYDPDTEQWYEVDENGIPLGGLDPDEESAEALPQTGDRDYTFYISLAFLSTAVGLIIMRPSGKKSTETN